MLDEETNTEPRVVSASIADPYLLLIRDDSSVFVAQIDDSNELEEVERTSETFISTKWLTGCLYTDTRGVFAQAQNDKGMEVRDSIFMFLVNTAGALHVRLLVAICRRSS
jgi:cleavage and polyadenylation specificity factor subunit 1